MSILSLKEALLARARDCLWRSSRAANTRANPSRGAVDKRYSAWALREEREGGQLSRNLAGFVKHVKERHGGVMGIGKYRGHYFDELLKNEPEHVEWAQSLASPGNAFKELADFAREQEEAGTKQT